MKFTHHIGLDIGAGTIKIVQVEPIVGSADRFRLLAFGQFPTPEFSNPMEQQLALGDGIKKLLKDLRIGVKQVVMGLPESQVSSRVIEMPYLEEPELSAAIRWQAEQYIPEPLSEVVLKHQVLSMPEVGVPNAKMDVLLVAAPNSLINMYLAVLSKAGLEALALETEMFAVIRSLLPPSAESVPTTLLVNIGSQTTSLAVWANGNLSLVQTIGTGGAVITRAVASGLGLEVVQAEEYKKTYGLDESKLEGKVQAAIKPVVDLIMGEAKRAIVYYETHKGGDSVKRLLLSGGSVLIPGLVQYLALGLGLEVELGNPFASIEQTDDQKREMGEDGPAYATAAGLAIRST